MVSHKAYIGTFGRVLVNMSHQRVHDEFADAPALMFRQDGNIDYFKETLTVPDDAAYPNSFIIAQNRNSKK